MDMNNKLSIEFSSTERQNFMAALQTIRTILDGKVSRLTTEERQRYGSINETNKGIVNKVNDFLDTVPSQDLPNFIDAAEFKKDFAARTVIESFLSELQDMVELLNGTKILLDHDNYTEALGIYQYVQVAARMRVDRMDYWANEMAQFFPRGKRPNLTEEKKEEGNEEPPQNV